ncbi:MAG: hypothetical protein WAL03_20555, partial [Pseudolabrys sp.]
MCVRHYNITISKVDRCTERFAQAGGALDHGIQYRLHSDLRLADDLQDLRGRRLLLKRLGEVVSTLAQLVKQARVLNGNN